MTKKLVRKTRRLVVRPMELKDFLAWKTTHLTALADRNTWDRGARKPEELTRVAFAKIIRAAKENIRKDRFYDLGVFEKSGALVGGVAIMEVARGISHTAFLGYRMYNRHWGKGYAREAVIACFDIAFKDLRLHRLEAGIEPENRRSLRLAKSLGMRREGLKKRALYLRKHWVDLVMYTVTTEDLGYKFNEKIFEEWKPRV